MVTGHMGTGTVLSFYTLGVYRTRAHGVTVIGGYTADLFSQVSLKFLFIFSQFMFYSKHLNFFLGDVTSSQHSTQPTIRVCVFH